MSRELLTLDKRRRVGSTGWMMEKNSVTIFSENVSFYKGKYENVRTVNLIMRAKLLLKFVDCIIMIVWNFMNPFVDRLCFIILFSERWSSNTCETWSSNYLQICLFQSHILLVYCFREGGTLLILFKNHVKKKRRMGGQSECQKFAEYNCILLIFRRKFSKIQSEKIIFSGQIVPNMSQTCLTWSK